MHKIQESLDILDQLRLPHGLYLASPSTDYSYVWLRDTFYEVLPYLHRDCDRYVKTYHRILDLFREYEDKITYHTKNKPTEQWQYIHARYSAHDVKEIYTPWGHSQNDAIGAILFGIGEGIRVGKKIIRDDMDMQIIQKLVNYLETLQYWKDEDSGMWEEHRECRSSSIGACVAGLRSVQNIVYVPEYIIDYGMTSLYELFPYETPTRKFDLAQMSLIYPYRVFDDQMASVIIRQVEKHLLRTMGVLRYNGDSYYSTLEEEHGRGRSREFYRGKEAEWTFGIPWLSLCCTQIGLMGKAWNYILHTESVMLENGVLPELYYSGTNKPNPNTPLGWAQAMYILAVEEFYNHDI